MANKRYRDQTVAKRPDVAAQKRVERAKSKVRELYNKGGRLNRDGASEFYRSEVDVQTHAKSYTGGQAGGGTASMAGKMAEEMGKPRKKRK